MTDNPGAYWVDWTHDGQSHSEGFDTETAAQRKFNAVKKKRPLKAQAYYMPADDGREPYIIDEYPEPPEDEE